MNILVTGNMGYIGPALIKLLREYRPDARVIGVDNGFFAHSLTAAARLPETMYDEQWFMDVRDIPAEKLRGIDSIIHLAAVSNDPMGNAFEAVTGEINHLASVRLAKLAKDAGVKSFVFASSCSVYGYAEGDARTESSPLNPLTAYAKSKISTELDIEPLANEDFVVTSLRFPTACGMSDRLRLDLVVNDFVAAAVSAKRIEILSDGTPWRPMIDIKDMSRAMFWAAQRSADVGGQFLSVNTGRTEWNYQIKDLAEAVRGVIPGVDVSINKDAAPDKRSYRVDFSLFAELAPDFLPQVPIMQSIEELKIGLEAMQFSDADFRQSSFMRLRILKSFFESGALTEDLRWSA